jgi:hypothetical protein
LELHLAVLGGARDLDPLVVVVDGDGQRAFRLFLSDHVLVEDRVDLFRLRQALDVERRGGGELLVDDLVAEIDAFVADVDARASDELFDLALRLPAEAAEELFVGVRGARHFPLPGGGTLCLKLRGWRRSEPLLFALPLRNPVQSRPTWAQRR